MALSTELRRRLRISLGSSGFGNELANAINNSTFDTFGEQRLKITAILDLTDINTKSRQIISQMPAGYIVRYVGMRILELVVAGGTSVKLGIGPLADVDQYGISADLAVDSGFSKLFNDQPLASATDFYLNACLSNGSDLGNTAISAGKVFVSIAYSQPAGS